MNEQELAQFVEWLPSSVNEFKDKTLKEIVTILNKMSQTEEGMNTISGLINEFKKSSQMLKKGGKITSLINKFQNGGKPKAVEMLPFVQGLTSIPAGMDKFDYNHKYSDGYRASQFSNKKGDILQFLQRPNTVGGTQRLITNNLQDTTYMNTFNGSKVSNSSQPWYTPKSQKEKKKADYNRFTQRFSEYFPTTTSRNIYNRETNKNSSSDSFVDSNTGNLVMSRAWSNKKFPRDTVYTYKQNVKGKPIYMTGKGEPFRNQFNELLLDTNAIGFDKNSSETLDIERSKINKNKK